jgi:hypothetical protein
MCGVNTLLITYDLNRPGQDYSKLFDYLKRFGTWCHPLDSTWLIRSAKSVVDVRNELKAYVDGNDGVLVMNVTGANWASLGLSAQVNDWLRQHV